MSERSRWTSEVIDILSSRSKDYRKSMRNSLGLEKRDYGVESPNELIKQLGVQKDRQSNTSKCFLRKMEEFL